MKKNTQLSVALHALLHLARSPRAPMTSERLAACLHTNPVVVRRTMGSLRKAGLVNSTAGRGGGWKLARRVEGITLKNVYAALGEGLLFAIDQAPSDTDCSIERVLSSSMANFFRDAETLLMERLDRITFNDLLSSVHNEEKQKNAKKKGRWYYLGDV